jgi:hypothetical protein
MKKQKNECANLRKVENRWRWMAGATAATAAGAASAQGGMITVNLVGNLITSPAGNFLNADLTGDGKPDLTITNAHYSMVNRVYPYTDPSFNDYFVRVTLNGVGASGYHKHEPYNFVRLGSQTHFNTLSVYPITGSIPISFKDLHINGGALTKGSLEVTVSPQEIQLDSFTYNTRENVPDQGSSLALLAIGASGVLVLRRLRTAQKQS